jgi:2-keto-4-pentenoate hydratase/2-oxohepta-3-ene-1,7-dioic acid hydratase in catechol pathway
VFLHDLQSIVTNKTSHTMKIICIGRNYADHAKELNNAVPAQPVIFCKPDTALLDNNEPFYYPSFTTNLHYELELVLKINKQGKNIGEKFAHRYYNQITVGIDFTARDIQDQVKEKGLPWERAKAFDNSAVVGTFVELDSLANASNIEFQLHKNNSLVQHGFSQDMLFNFDKIIAEISTFITLRTGDLIYTGTPAGVGAVAIGDVLVGTLEGKELLNFEIK